MGSETAGVPEGLKERLKASYDAIAPVYNKWTIPHYAYRTQYLEMALQRLNLADRSGGDPAFLELGCGCGLPATQMLLQAHPSARVVANDLSETQLALARENLIQTPNSDDQIARRLELVQGDMSALEFQDASFDLVVALFSFIHLPRVEQEALFQRVSRWLRPGGFFLANFSRDDTESAVIEKWLDEKGWMYWSGWGQQKTLDKLREVGFEIEVAEVVDEKNAHTAFVWVIAKL